MPLARHSNHLPDLGVGIVYSSGIESLLRENPALVDVVEVEPQTLWVENPASPGAIQARSDVDDHLASLPGRKLVHSIGTPVGGSVDALDLQLPLLREAVRKLHAPYASEHLAFNLTPDFFTGFFLPPRQTAPGIEIYKGAIARLQDRLGVPLAIETGVNYLKPRKDEIPDGEFVAQLVEPAACGILLDLHNIYCNQRNGRQPVDLFLSQIPLDAVWEIHLAGGFEMDGFWLDAHSGAIPGPLFEIARGVVPHLPNLKAIVFEIFPSFLAAFGLDAVKREIEKLRLLWELRRPRARPVPISRTSPTPEQTASAPGVVEWEQSLGRMAIGFAPRNPLEESLAEDRGVGLVRNLVNEFRASMVVSVYRLTSRLLMLALTPDVFRVLLQEYWARFAPRSYAGTEADSFYSFLVSKNLRVPWFQKVYEFERAAMLTMFDDQTRVVRFSSDPLPMLRALAEGRLPDIVPKEGDYEIELTADGPIAVSGVDLDEVAGTFPFH